MVQGDLFGHKPEPAGPAGFDYRADILSTAEQSIAVEQLQRLGFRPYEHGGYQGFRHIAAFGRRHDLAQGRMGATDPWPDFMLDLLRRIARRVGADEGVFVQALVNRYAPGAGIGWHRDRPVYGEILGVSFLAPCLMRLRRREEAGWRRDAVLLDPGSVYRLSGEARRDWEHSISPMTALRYSITFRTLASPTASVSAQDLL